MPKINYRGMLKRHFQGQVPAYIGVVGKNFITLKTADFRGSATDRVTARQVVEYFRGGHGMSGMRCLGPISGDWRQIDHLAGLCLNWFITTGAIERS
jgi:hypothetical protein